MTERVLVSDANSKRTQVLLDGVDAVYPLPSGPLVALSAIGLNVDRGEFLSVIGPSGCGKSTLLRIIGGLQSPTSGTVTIDGRPPREIQREKQIGYVFQDPTLLAWRTVRENVELPRRVNRKSGGQDPDALIDLVGLSAFRGLYPFQLSGGMQQRVALARALVTSPSLLLMDEPFGALDEITRSSMRYELLRIWRSGASEGTVVFVTHSIAEAVLLSDRVVVLTARPGRIALELEIDLPRPRTEGIEMEPDFLGYCRDLRAVLRGRSAA